MCRKYILMIVIMIACIMLSACQKQNDTLVKNDSGLTDSQVVETQGESVDIYPAITFSGYQEYFDFFQKSTAQSLTTEGELVVSDRMNTYIQTARNEPETLVIPCYDGNPVVLREIEGYDAITVLDKELYGFLWTWFYTRLGEDSVTIQVSRLSEENHSLASEMSCSEFITTIAPTAPNINNYHEKANYHLIYEDNTVVDGVTTSMLIKQTKDGGEYISFVTEGCLVIISAPVGTITEDWLCDFSLAAFSK